jgi:hypothetical protein
MRIIVCFDSPKVGNSGGCVDTPTILNYCCATI